MEKEVTIHGKLTAIQYLVDHSVYGNEWQGAGMWHAVMDVMANKDTTFLKSHLDGLLKSAEDF